MTPDYFAYNQYRDHVVYKALAERELNPEFKKILEILVEQEFDDYMFWKQFASRTEFHVRPVEIALFCMMRRVLGLTFTARFLEGHEKEMQHLYSAYLETVTDPAMRRKMTELVAREREHERYLVSQVREDKVEFMSSIILGLNDGLIELTGALVGFSLALRSASLVGLTGLITGVSAALSMASSAYMQAEYEEGKNARKAALYTGCSYLVVVLLLVAPFFLLQSSLLAAFSMFAFTVAIIAAVSWYTSVLFERPFHRQFMQMFFFSVGVATVAFSVGLAARTVLGVSLFAT